MESTAARDLTVSVGSGELRFRFGLEPGLHRDDSEGSITVYVDSDIIRNIILSQNPVSDTQHESDLTLVFRFAALRMSQTIDTTKSTSLKLAENIFVATFSSQLPVSARSRMFVVCRSFPRKPDRRCSRRDRPFRTQ
jgi:hypothetical protein